MTVASKDLMARALLLMFGTALLFPWNALITAVDYFSIIFPGHHVDRVFSVVYMSANLSALLFAVHFDFIAGRKRVVLGFLGYVILMTIVPLCDIMQVENERGSTLYWWTIVAIVGSTGLADGLCQGALYGQASLMPDEHTKVRFKHCEFVVYGFHSFVDE